MRMARTNPLSLSPSTLVMPSVDGLTNKLTLNFLLQRQFGGPPVRLQRDPPSLSIAMNLCRLTDKALREYDASRTELTLYLEPNDSPGIRISPYLRAIDHMENSVDATHRAILNIRALRERRQAGGALPITSVQERDVKRIRDAVEHSDEKLLGRQRFKHSPPFGPSDPYSLRLSDKGMTIGQWELTFVSLVTVMAKCHHTIEAIRKAPTGRFGPNFPNAKLRTDPGSPAAPTGNMYATDYTRELTRLMVTH